MSDLKEVYNGTGDLMIKMTSLGGNQKAFLPPRGEDPTVNSLVNSRWSFGLMAKAWKQADFAAEAAKEKELDYCCNWAWSASAIAFFVECSLTNFHGGLPALQLPK